MLESSQLLAVLLKCAVALAIGAWVGYRLLDAWHDRQLSGPEIGLLAFVLLALLTLAIKLSSSPWFFPVIGGLVALWGGAALLHRWAETRQRRKMLEADLRRFQEVLDFDPSNTAGYSFMAETYKKMGNLEKAIEYYRKALALEPGLAEETVKLARVVLERARREGRMMFCPRCEETRTPGQHSCAGCGRSFSSNETIAYNFRRLPRGERYVHLAGALAATVLVLLLAAEGPGWLAGLLAIVFLGLGIRRLRHWARWP